MSEQLCPRCGHRTCPTLRGEQSPEAEEYHLTLLREMRECDHPPMFRADPGWPSPDPQEWRCEVCGTAQVRDMATRRDSPNTETAKNG